MKRYLGYIVLMIFNGALGYVLHPIPNLLASDGLFDGKGPLIFLPFIIMIAIYYAIGWLQSKFAKWAGLTGNVVLAAVCALLAGAAITVGFAVNIWQGNYIAWGNLLYLLFIGIGAGATSFIAIRY